MKEETGAMSAARTTAKKSQSLATAQFIVFSLLGIFMFFIDITIGGKKTIPIQHVIDWLTRMLGPAIPYYALIMVVAGAASPIIKGTYKKSAFDLVFTVAKALGAVIGVMAVFNIGPAYLMQPDYIPFLWKSIVVPIAMMIPVAGLGFVMLMNYGLVEFIGKFMQSIMRKVWHTPGESAVDAIVSFTGGYAMAVLFTNNLYKRGIYTARESVIIATGFSTVSVSFLIVIANTLGFMDRWNLFFFSCLVVTFVVTAITARLYPINKMPDTYWDQPAKLMENEKGNLFKQAWEAGIDAVKHTQPLTVHLKDYYIGDAIKMSSAVTASILSIGLLGILLANLTPLFDVIGYLFYPFTLLLQLPEPLLAAKAAAIEVAEMFLPALLVVQTPMVTKFTIAVTSVSAVLFFSASIPALLSTDIPIKMKDILIIWIERTILSLIMAAGIAHIFF